MNLVWSLGRRWQSWAALVLLCVALEGGALFYQRVLYYFPCELCIYTRVWIAGIGVLGVVGWLVRGTSWPLRAVLLGELALVAGLAGVVWKLLAIDYGFADDGTCNLFAQFPTWAPLDQWLPALFEVQATCGETPEVLFGVSMADGLAVITLALAVVFTLALVGSFRWRAPQ